MDYLYLLNCHMHGAILWYVAQIQVQPPGSEEAPKGEEETVGGLSKRARGVDN